MKKSNVILFVIAVIFCFLVVAVVSPGIQPN